MYLNIFLPFGWVIRNEWIDYSQGANEAVRYREIDKASVE